MRGASPWESAAACAEWLVQGGLAEPSSPAALTIYQAEENAKLSFATCIMSLTTHESHLRTKTS